MGGSAMRSALLLAVLVILGHSWASNNTLLGQSFEVCFSTSSTSGPYGSKMTWGVIAASPSGSAVISTPTVVSVVESDAVTQHLAVEADGQLVIEEDGKLTIEGGGAAITQCSTVYVLSPAANPPPPASADGAAEARIAA